jgi:nucleotide sugar dehydrogenase
MSRNDRTGNETIGIVGTGYVGLHLALAFEESGFDVVGVDIDPERIRAIRSADLDEVESDRVERALEGGLRVTTRTGPLTECDVYVFAVPTDLEDGNPDFSALSAAVDMAAESDPSDGSLFVVSSTIHPGVIDEIVEPRLADRGVDDDVRVAVVPERIDPGSGQGVGDIPHVVGSDTERGREYAAALFENVVEEVHVVPSAAAAAVSKLIENSYRLLNIAMVNELALVAEHSDIDIWESIDAAATKPFGFEPFYPGPGAGGHCIPVDPLFLTEWSESNGVALQTVELAWRCNEEMPSRVVERLDATCRNPRLEDAEILAFGMSYKPNVPIVQNAAAKRICSMLARRGADVTVVEPHVAPEDVQTDVSITQSVPDETADLALYLVDHDEFEQQSVLESGELVYDVTGTLDRAASERVVAFGGANREDARREDALREFGAVQ